MTPLLPILHATCGGRGHHTGSPKPSTGGTVRVTRNDPVTRTAPPVRAARMCPEPALNAVDLLVQPRAGEGPVAVGGRGGDAEHAARLFQREAGEVAQLHELRFSRVDLREPLQRLVEGEQVVA